MEKKKEKDRTIGIVGAYGVIGSTVAKELMKSVDCNLLIGGRNKKSVEELCNKLGPKAKGKQIDINDENSLKEFCKECAVVVNCAGPSWIIKDRVIKISSDFGCDYIDPGIWLDKDDAYKNLFEKKGLTGMLYAGWIPGLSGLLPRYLYYEALNRFDSINSLNVYLGDRSVWSNNAMFDALYHFVRDVKPGYFENGRWVSKNDLYAIFGSKIYKHPGNIGRYLVTPVDAIELRALANEAKLPKIGCYAGIAGLSTILKVMYIRYLHVKDDSAVKILTNAFIQESQEHGTGGAISCVISGKKDGKIAHMSANICEKDTVWLTSIATVVAVRLLVEKKVNEHGLQFFCDAVDPTAFFKILKSYGVLCNLIDLNGRNFVI